MLCIFVIKRGIILGQLPQNQILRQKKISQGVIKKVAPGETKKRMGESKTGKERASQGGN